MTPGDGTQKKYVRTFASDMEAVQKGGTPDLTALSEMPEQPLPPEPPAPPPADTLVLPPKSEQPLPIVLQSTIAAVPAPAPAPRPQPIVMPKPEPKEPEIDLDSEAPLPKLDFTAPQPPVVVAGTLKTYAGDFAERMKRSNASLTTVLAAEQDAGVAAPPPETASKTSLVLIVAGVLLVLAGIIGGSAAYFYYASVSAPVTFTQEAKPPIFVDEREQISGEGSQLMQAIQKSAQKPLAAGSVRFLYLDNQNSSIFAALHFLAPDILERNVNADGSMFGIINTGIAPEKSHGGSQNPFFILSVASYSGSFSGMLSWEPLIRHDLGTLFPAYQDEKTPLPSSIQATFKDETIANHDVRVFRDPTGETVLIYGYWDQKTLVIARNPPAFVELLRRLAAARMN